MAVKRQTDPNTPAADQLENVGDRITIDETTEMEQKAAEDIGGFSVYLGPSIHGVIQSGTVYGDSREDTIKALSGVVEKHPLIARLIVDGKELAESRLKVKTPGNALYEFYRQLASSE